MNIVFMPLWLSKTIPGYNRITPDRCLSTQSTNRDSYLSIIKTVLDFHLSGASPKHLRTKVTPDFHHIVKMGEIWGRNQNDKN